MDAVSKPTPPTWSSMLVDQARYQLRTYTRSPVAMFFTVGLPVVMLILFGSIFTGTVGPPGAEWSVTQFYTGGLAAFTAVSATYTATINMIPVRRDEGVLKRWHSTPLPKWVFFGGWVLSASMIAVVGVVLQLTIGIVFYNLVIDAAKLPALALTLIVGIGTFSSLGVAIAGLVPNAEAAPAVANATVLPLAFVSNIFIPLDDPPRWLAVVGDIFPLKPFAAAFQDTLNPMVAAPAFDWKRIVFIAAWGIVGAIVARSTFRWYPVRTAGKRRRRRHTKA